MFYLHFILLRNYPKDPTNTNLEEKKNHFNYQGQDEYQHLTLNLDKKSL